MNIYTGRNDNEIGLMSLLDDLIVLENGKRYTIDGYINKLQNNWNELKKFIEKEVKKTYELTTEDLKEERDLAVSVYKFIQWKMQKLEEK